MFKKIKRYFELKRRIQFEVLETLCTICLYMCHDGHYGRNPYARHMDSHFKSLKDLSTELRGDSEV